MNMVRKKVSPEDISNSSMKKNLTLMIFSRCSLVVAFLIIEQHIIDRIGELLNRDTILIRELIMLKPRILASSY
jgi:hypothetical protein